MEYRITYTYKTQAEAKSDEVEEFASEIATDVTEMHLFSSELFTLEKVEEIKPGSEEVEMRLSSNKIVDLGDDDLDI